MCWFHEIKKIEKNNSNCGIRKILGTLLIQYLLNYYANC